MFDIGFWELALIGVVALLVVGPDRLPGMARSVGLWVGRIRRYVGQVRDDIEREIRAEELREMMDKSKQLGELHDVVEETRGTMGEARRELERTEAEADPAAAERPAPGGGGEDADSEARKEESESKEESKPNPTDAAYTVGEAAGGGDSGEERAQSGEASESGDVSGGGDDERRTG